MKDILLTILRVTSLAAALIGVTSAWPVGIKHVTIIFSVLVWGVTAYVEGKEARI